MILTNLPSFDQKDDCLVWILIFCSYGMYIYFLLMFTAKQDREINKCHLWKPSFFASAFPGIFPTVFDILCQTLGLKMKACNASVKNVFKAHYEMKCSQV